MKQLLKLKWRLLPLIAAIAILAYPLAASLWHQHQASIAAHTAQASLRSSAKPVKIQGQPNRILIPSLNIDLPVVAQSYSTVTKTWPVAASTANYATETALINNTRGQSLIYGHSSRPVFGPLLDLKPGAIAYVYTNTGHLFKYSYTSSRDVTPTKTKIIPEMAQALTPGLKLITCDGPYFQYRHLMSFKFLQAS